MSARWEVVLTEAKSRAAREWFGGTEAALESLVRRFAEPRPAPLKLLDTLEGVHGRRFGPEMRAWIRVFERYEMEVADPAYAELKAPGETVGLTGLVEARGPAWIANVAGVLTASTVVLQQDAMSYLASLCGTESGVSKIYYFHPEDWGLWPTDPSLSVRLYRMLAEEDRDTFSKARFEPEEDQRRREALGRYEARTESETLPADWDPARLWPRVDWLLHALLGVGRDWSRELKRAAAFEVWRAEADRIVECPHLAVYWLWSHWFFDNQAALKEARRRLADAFDPVVSESKTQIGLLERKEKVWLGERDTSALWALRARFLEIAPMAVFEDETAARVRARRSVWLKEDALEDSAQTVLQEAAENEPLVREALLLVEHLARGGAVSLGPAPVHGGLALDEAIARLAELMDPRFSPLIRARLERSLHVGDTHQDAGYGLLLAWAALCKTLDAFEAPLLRLGTGQLGPRRMGELYRAYGRFDDPRAVEHLVQGARAWAQEMNDWIRMTPDAPVLELLSRDTLHTHQLIATILEQARFSAANWEVCVAAAVAAGALRSRQAVQGLRRAVELRLGRVDDGSRAKVTHALYLADGKGSLPFLRSLFDWACDEWEAASDEDDVDGLTKDLACYLAGLLPMAPDEPCIQEVARRLLSLFQLKMGPRRTPKKDFIAAASAILGGIRAGEVRALAGAVTPYRTLEFRETPSIRAAARALRGLAHTVEEELRA